MVDVAAMPATFVEFDDDISVTELDLETAAQKAAHNPDTWRWYEGSGAKRVYLITTATGKRFVYVLAVVDCWLSFLFPDPDAASSLPEKWEERPESGWQRD